jgi:hypothetical protein
MDQRRRIGALGGVAREPFRDRVVAPPAAPHIFAHTLGIEADGGAQRQRGLAIAEMVELGREALGAEALAAAQLE